jgi:hypothetical protein
MSQNPGSDDDKGMKGLVSLNTLSLSARQKWLTSGLNSNILTTQSWDSTPEMQNSGFNSLFRFSNSKSQILNPTHFFAFRIRKAKFSVRITFWLFEFEKRNSRPKLIFFAFRIRKAKFSVHLTFFSIPKTNL